MARKRFVVGVFPGKIKDFQAGNGGTKILIPLGVVIFNVR